MAAAATMSNTAFTPHLSNENARIAPRIGQKAMAILNNIDSAAKRVEEARNRYTRES